MNDAIDPSLQRLADAYGVATSFLDQMDRPVNVARETVVRVLDLLGAGGEDGILRVGALRDDEAMHPPTWGYEGEPIPAGPRGWGFMVQLYAIRSSDSWGIGDFADLATIVDWTGRHGGGVVLVNPLHAVAMIEPIQPSPYFPASRQWLNPIYLRIQDLPEYHAVEPVLRRRIDALKPLHLNESDRIDRDAVWAAKLAALELLFDPADVQPPTDRELDFVTWSALVEVHGADWRLWPPGLQRPDGAGIAAARDEFAERMLWHVWLQRRCDEQCRAAQARAAELGMPVGVMHDLAVGADPGGADAWIHQDLLVLDARIGSPPDDYNQRGQDWGMPPWHPQRLAASTYQPIRDLVHDSLARGGGLRIDHILGLFRTWWIPDGSSAADGTFVSYDASGLLAVIADEARGAGAVIVGEDLGTVPPEVRATLGSAGVLGTSLLLFERVEGDVDPNRPLRPLPQWREAAMASVTTHDLPTPLAWMRGDHVSLRGSLGQLKDPDAEQASWQRERDEMVAFLAAAGLARADDSDELLAVAMHRAAAATPSRWVVAAPSDAVEDLRQPNLPGTVDEYPNWRLAVTDRDGRPVLLEELLGDPRLEVLADELAAHLGGESANAGR